jgi:hypothetical protein
VFKVGADGLSGAVIAATSIVRHSTALRLDGVRRDVSPDELNGQRAE